MAGVPNPFSPREAEAMVQTGQAGLRSRSSATPELKIDPPLTAISPFPDFKSES